MAYAGYLIKVGSYTIPTDKFIRAESYKATLNVQDLDPFRDANGKLHRGALAHRVPKLEFETPAMLTNVEMSEFLGNIRKNYTVPAERKFSATVYVPELDDYITQDMYMTDPEFTIYGNYGGIIRYNPVRIAFTGY